MDKTITSVITAIADVAQESFIASSLNRLGFKVVYRATRSKELKQFLANDTEVLLIISDDFRDCGEIDAKDTVVIRGKSPFTTKNTAHNPTTDLELAEILRERKNLEVATTRIPAPCTSNVVLFTSSGQAAGTTTVAINFAHALVEDGEKVLLVDANFVHPDLADRFELHGIFRKLAETRFGFAVCEIESLESLNLFASQSTEFDTVVIDMGRFEKKRFDSLGRRIEDLTFSWALQSADIQFILAGEHQIENTKIVQSSALALNPKVKSALLLHLKAAVSARNREKLTAEITQKAGMKSFLISRDAKAVEKMERERSTIFDSSPKSMLKSEIVALRSCLNGG